MTKDTNTNKEANINNEMTVLNPTSENGNTTGTKIYNEFIESNKEFFEKMGFKDISDDIIFTLSQPTEMTRSTDNSCTSCNKEISRYFSKHKFWYGLKLY
jgi:hypothetical protein